MRKKQYINLLIIVLIMLGITVSCIVIGGKLNEMVFREHQAQKANKETYSSQHYDDYLPVKSTDSWVYDDEEDKTESAEVKEDTTINQTETYKEGYSSAGTLQEYDIDADSDMSSSNSSTGSSSNGNSSYSNTHSSNSTHYQSDPYDVYDYDDPDDFAYDWAEEFGDGAEWEDSDAWEDGYDEAYDYWEDEYED